MSGPLGSSQWMYSSGFYPYEIEQSLRFNDDDSAYLSRSVSGGSTTTFTFSTWLKRGNLGNQRIYRSDSGGIEFAYLGFSASDQLEFFARDNGAATLASLITSAVFRDPSAWYHIVLHVDTAQATASDRIRLYVNGQQITQFGTATYPTLSGGVLGLNGTGTTLFRNGSTTNLYFDGCAAEVNFIDGQALDPTSFGEFKSGVWIPKKYTGSYGTNGFYLSFADSAAIGDDLSGNGNDWTPSGLASTDVLLDSPTNNWATFSAISGTSGGTLSEGNLRVSTGLGTKPANWLLQSGKWYWEARGLRYAAAVCGPDGQNYSNSISNTGSKGLGWWQAGPVYWDGGFSGASLSYTSTDILGIALDMDAGTIAFYKNNTLFTTITFGSGTVPAFADGVFPCTNGGGGSGTINLNFGQDSSFAGAVTRQGNVDANGRGDFYYAPPAGYLALCTANLPEPAITPALDDVPSDYFNTVLYTGNGSTNAITGVGFQPDLLWAKARSTTAFHYLQDAVRGVDKALFSNATDAEFSIVTTDTTFDTDGFTFVGAESGLNQSATTYVAWNWKANGAGVSNTDGTITSTVSANQKAGFSIVSWEAQATAVTVGHGLGAIPKFIVMKDRDGVFSWFVYHQANGTDGYVLLNDTGGFLSNTTVFSTAPTSTVFDPGTGFITGNGHASQIAYCFAEVEGYSKFGSYTGNGSTDGPFVWCGFRPSWVMVKRTDTTGGWLLHDDARNPYNPEDLLLRPDVANAETTGGNTQHDFLSNGFKIRSVNTDFNASGGTYIFAAFAEQPFKYSGGR